MPETAKPKVPTCGAGRGGGAGADGGGGASATGGGGVVVVAQAVRRTAAEAAASQAGRTDIREAHSFGAGPAPRGLGRFIHLSRRLASVTACSFAQLGQPR